MPVSDAASRHFRDDLIEHVEGHLQDLIRDAELNGWNPNVYRSFARLNGAWVRAYREAGHTHMTEDGFNSPKVRALPTSPGFADDRRLTRCGR